MDLTVTADDTIVISHDPILKSRVLIRELSLNQLRDAHAHIPTLDQVLSLSTQGDFDFYLEIKSFPDKPAYSPAPELFAQFVLDHVSHHKLENRVVILSFDFRTLRAMKTLAPQIRLSALTENDPRDFASITHDASTQMMSPHFKLVTASKTAAAHAAGIPVVPWTANTPTEWAPLIAAGVDCIITDHPASLITYLQAHSGATIQIQ